MASLRHVCGSLLLLGGVYSTDSDGYCNGIEAGGIMVSGFNMDNPDEVVLVAVESVGEGATFFMTDRPWDGTQFLDWDNDGTLKWTFQRDFPSSLELCFQCTLDGSVVNQFEPVLTGNSNRTFSLNSSGDTIILYCMTEPENGNGASSIRHIAAITNSGPWETNATAIVSEGDSLLPVDLPNDTVTTLQGFPNFEYDGQQVGTASEIRAGLSTARHWDGSDEYIENLQTKSSFKVEDDEDHSASFYNALSVLNVSLMLVNALCLLTVCIS